MESANSTNNFHYNKFLQKNANYLRKHMTKAEACLWKYVLKARKFYGYQFRRQRPVLRYIADFMCKELNLIIEVDGESHLLPEVIKKDRIRQKELENAGFTVLRFRDEEVLMEIDRVMERMEEFLREYELKKNI